MSSRSVSVTSAVAAVATVGGLALVTKFALSRWMAMKQVAVLRKIIIYPFKSLQGIEVEGAECTDQGLAYKQLKDRHFMLVDENGKSVSFSRETSLCFIKVWHEDMDLCIDAENMTLLRLPLVYEKEDKDKLKTLRVRMWVHNVEAVDCGDEAAEWFQKYLGKPGFRVVRFLRYAEPAEEAFIGRYFLKAFHYGVTYHLLSQPSVDLLNSKSTEEAATFKNFRPNFVVDKCNAHDEDYWKSLQIGKEVKLNFTERCFRCADTRVNQDTGTMTKTHPYETMRKYRMPDTPYTRKKYRLSPLFGVLLSQKKGGTIFVGDPVLAHVSSKPLI